jgi:fucose 4-O-acetylase-like acetyltransferase
MGIVTYHANIPGLEWPGSGIVVFLLGSFFFGGRAAHPWHLVQAYRASRLLVPWAIWFVVYGLLNLRREQPFWATDQGWLAGLLSGSSLHLWYLPFVFLALLALDGVRALLNWRWQVVLGAVGSVVLLGTGAWREALPSATPWPQWGYSLPAWCMALVLLQHARLSRAVKLALVALAATVTALWCPDYRMAIPYLFGLFALLLLGSQWLASRLPWDPTPISRNTMGIYLAHPLGLSLAMKLGVPLGWGRPVIAFAAAWLLVEALRRGAPRLSRWLF